MWESATPILKTNYVPLNINPQNDGLSMDLNFKPRVIFAGFTDAGNIQSVSKTLDVPITYLWGYNNSFPIAKITNSSKSSDVAITSFEAQGEGNWVFTPNINVSDFITGINSHNIANSLQKTGLDLLKRYKLSFWYKGGTVNVSASPVAGTFVTFTHATKNWIYWEAIVTGIGNIILSKGSGTTVLIDEVRLHPEAANVETYTYHPVRGMTTMTDMNNFTTYYEFDRFGKLKMVKDKDLNVMSIYDYVYKIR